MPEESPGWSSGQRAFGSFAPGLVHYTDRVLFDEVWERPELSKRDRSLATVAALIAGGNIEQLNFHLPFAKQNGVTEEELIETITHLAFYTAQGHVRDDRGQESTQVPSGWKRLNTIAIPRYSATTRSSKE